MCVCACVLVVFASYVYSCIVCYSVLQEMLNKADCDGDGEINEEDFLKLMRKTSLY